MEFWYQMYHTAIYGQMLKKDLLIDLFKVVQWQILHAYSGREHINK